MSVMHAQPKLSHSQVSEMAQRLYGLTPSVIHVLPSYDDQNFYIKASKGDEYVLKIINCEDSKNPNLIEVHTYAMSFLYQHGLPTQTALPSVTGHLMTLEEIDCGFGCQKYLVRLLTYLPGCTVSEIPLSTQLLYKIGKTAARMDKILGQMEHPYLNVLKRDKFMWNLSNVPLLEAYISVLDGDPLQHIVKSVIHQYNNSVLPKLSSFRKCINHGDFNHFNILVEPDESDGYRISGILDFGDINSGYYVHELAITITYMMMKHPEPMEVGGPLLAGWESVLPFNPAEKDSLYVLVLSRFCQSVVLGRYTLSMHPENEEYVISTFKKGIPILRQLWEWGKEKVEKVWFQTTTQYSDGK